MIHQDRLPLRPITLDYARSWLIVSGARPDIFNSAHQGPADAVIFDLEDGVIPAARTAARYDVQQWLTHSGRGWVRINNATTPDWSADLDTVQALPGLDGVLLAKTESAEQVIDTINRLSAGTPVVALIESALGIEHAYAIAAAHGTRRLAFGSGDFRRDTGAENDPSGLAYARSRLVVASRAANLPGPIDGPTVPGGATSLTEDLSIAACLGLTAKICMRSDDVPEINDAFTPSDQDIEWAAQTIDQFGANGEWVQDGSDLPKLARAHKITQLMKIFA